MNVVLKITLMVNLALAVSALPFFGEDVVVPEVEDALVPEIMFHEDMDFTPTSDHGPKQPDNSGVTAYSSDGKTEAPFTDAPGDSTANPAEKAIKQVYEGCLEQGHKMVAEHKIQIEKQLESNNKNLKKIFEQEQAMCAKFDDNADACTKSVVVQARSEQAKFHKQAKAQLKMAQEDFEKHHALCHKHAEDLTGNAQECQANFAAEVKKQQTDLMKSMNEGLKSMQDEHNARVEAEMGKCGDDDECKRNVDKMAKKHAEEAKASMKDQIDAHVKKITDIAEMGPAMCAFAVLKNYMDITESAPPSVFLQRDPATSDVETAAKNIMDKCAAEGEARKKAREEEVKERIDSHNKMIHSTVKDVVKNCDKSSNDQDSVKSCIAEAEKNAGEQVSDFAKFAKSEMESATKDHATDMANCQRQAGHLMHGAQKCLKEHSKAVTQHVEAMQAEAEKKKAVAMADLGNTYKEKIKECQGNNSCIKSVNAKMAKVEEEHQAQYEAHKSAVSAQIDEHVKSAPAKCVEAMKEHADLQAPVPTDANPVHEVIKNVFDECHSEAEEKKYSMQKRMETHLATQEKEIAEHADEVYKKLHQAYENEVKNCENFDGDNKKDCLDMIQKQTKSQFDKFHSEHKDAIRSVHSEAKAQRKKFEKQIIEHHESCRHITQKLVSQAQKCQDEYVNQVQSIEKDMISNMNKELKKMQTDFEDHEEAEKAKCEDDACRAAIEKMAKEKMVKQKNIIMKDVQKATTHITNTMAMGPAMCADAVIKSVKSSEVHHKLSVAKVPAAAVTYSSTAAKVATEGHRMEKMEHAAREGTTVHVKDEPSRGKTKAQEEAEALRKATQADENNEVQNDKLTDMMPGPCDNIDPKEEPCCLLTNRIGQSHCLKTKETANRNTPHSVNFLQQYHSAATTYTSGPTAYTSAAPVPTEQNTNPAEAMVHQLQDQCHAHAEEQLKLNMEHTQAALKQGEKALKDTFHMMAKACEYMGDHEGTAECIKKNHETAHRKLEIMREETHEVMKKVKKSHENAVSNCQRMTEGLQAGMQKCQEDFHAVVKKVHAKMVAEAAHGPTKCAESMMSSMAGATAAWTGAGRSEAAHKKDEATVLTDADDEDDLTASSGRRGGGGGGGHMPHLPHLPGGR